MGCLKLKLLSLLLLLTASALAQERPVRQAQSLRTSGTITTSSSTVSAGTIGYGVATVTVNGTYAGVTVNFEFSDDGSNWYSDTCTRSDTALQESSEALPSNQSRAWDCGVSAATNFRVRSSAYSSGTANIGITLSAAAIEPAPTVSVGNTPNVNVQSDATVNLDKIAGSTAVADPCQVNAKNYANVSQTTNTKIVSGTSAKKIYICSLHLVTATAQNVALVEGTGTACATTTVAVDGLGGGGTAATGWNLAANGGLTYGNGVSSLGAEHTAADDLCVFQSGSGQLSGGFTYVVQ